LERLEAALAGGDTPSVSAPSADMGSDPSLPKVEEEAEKPSGPVAQAVAVVDALDLERLRGLYPAVLDQVRQSGSEALSQVLEAARPLAVDAEAAVMKLGFPPSASFNKRKAENSDARERLADAIKTIVGERLRPVFVLMESEPDQEAPAPDMTEDEVVERVKSEFGAEEYFEDAEEAAS
jgi:hypothetical protein